MSQGTHNGHTVNVFMCNASQTSVMHTQQVSDFIGESRTNVRRQEVAKIGGGSLFKALLSIFLRAYIMLFLSLSE